MKDDSHIISGFDHDSGSNNTPFVVDFATARLLNRSGSTCDAYECVIQRRRVFVKRLKAEYRDNPLYRAAFSKEYDLGVSLSHPSLPRYVGFGDGYMAMDFIEGDTLADLMKRGDKRLDDKRFVCRLLKELIDVVEYLHLRNIVHCDIKADNIMVSPYHDRVITLIDLDKAYTSWLNDTSGNPEKYGCDGCADGAIDFKGIGIIAAKLGFKKLAKACDNSDVSANSLRRLLSNRTKILWWIVAGIIVVGFAVAIAFLPGNAPVSDIEPSLSNTEDIVSDTTVVVVDTMTRQPQQQVSRKPAIDNVWISELIAEKASEIQGYRRKLLNILDDDSIPPSDKLDAIMDYTSSAGLAQNQIIFSAVSHYSNISEIEVQNAVRVNPAWVRLNEEELEMLNRINGWQAKVSRRPSDRPVSQPDTTQDAGLHVQHR
ncbi:protein kinase [uncultured Duncaniella sp.]|uniref:serine/threonine protein kinase n=1 Tax=uncultured Duncaniella sp. TaxID=2768039 RepID=UPI00272A2B20|nr:protein kinase [uncultured Duncaniella sp.]